MKVDLGDVPGWVAFATATAAVVVALRANRHAKESAKASMDSALSARRSADAAERQALAAEQALPPPPSEVAWEIEWVSKQRYRLRNVGTHPATGVTVQEDGALLWPYPIPDPVPARGAVSFYIVESGGSLAPNELLVSWEGQSEPAAVPLL